MANNNVTPRQVEFVNAYCAIGEPSYGNGVEAARAAGYKGNPRTLGVMAYRYLKLPKIQRLIAAKKAEQAKKHDWCEKKAMERLEKAYELAMANQQPSAAVSAVVAVNRMFGLDKQVSRVETAPKLSDDERAVLRDLADEYKRRRALRLRGA